jgi:transcriptional regulator GlxA family with amidase domain
MQEIGFVVYPGFQVMSFAVVSVFEIANTVLGKSGYQVSLLSEKGGLVRAPAGFCVETNAFGSATFDTALSHCLEASRAKGMCLFSGNLAADCFPLTHGMQAVISDLKC